VPKHVVNRRVKLNGENVRLFASKIIIIKNLLSLQWLEICIRH
jgi:hypothetical protein